MNSRNRIFAIIMTLFLGVNTNVIAQDMEKGTWTGSLLLPSGQTFDVEYVVSEAEGELVIEITAPGQNPLQATDIELSDDGLMFFFQPGPLVQCDLQRKANGSFEGTCAPDGEDEATMIMNPPKGDS